MLKDKSEIVVETLTEPPAPPHAALCPGLPKPEHHYQHAAGQAYEADCGAAHYSIRLVHQCVYCNSGLDKGSSESGHDYRNKPAAIPKPFEEAPWPFGFQLLLETHPRLAKRLIA